MLYKVVGTRVVSDSDGNTFKSEVRDYALTQEEIAEIEYLEELKLR